MNQELSAHEKAAATQPHGSHGHFVSKPHAENQPSESPSQASSLQHQASTTDPSSSVQHPTHQTLSDELKKQISIQTSKDENMLLDVKVNNPLKKITQLLQDIKKQKAFSFDIKGSLGVAGVLVVLTTFGIFGGTHALCSRGTQTQIGFLKSLQYIDPPNTSLWIRTQNLWRAARGEALIDEKLPPQRVVLIKRDQTVIQILIQNKIDFAPLFNQYVFATGDYDTCSQTLTISQPTGIESTR